MNYYSALERSRLLIHATTWTSLEVIYAEWKKPDEKGKHITWFHFCETSRRHQSIQKERPNHSERKISGFLGLGRRGDAPSGMTRVFWNQMMSVVAQLCEYHWIIHLKVWILWHVSYVSMKLSLKNMGSQPPLVYLSHLHFPLVFKVWWNVGFLIGTFH